VIRLQNLGGTFLYCARAVDPTLIMPVNVLASEQTKSTAATVDKIIKLLNYCTTHPEATLRYHASEIILNIHSDASYLSKMEAKSLAGGGSTWAVTLTKPTNSPMEPLSSSALSSNM
jgi:hypothetical protein